MASRTIENDTSLDDGHDYYVYALLGEVVLIIALIAGAFFQIIPAGWHSAYFVHRRHCVIRDCLEKTCLFACASGSVHYGITRLSLAPSLRVSLNK